jgi:hypothetical protein
MKQSNEVEILLEAIKVCMLDKPTNKLAILLQREIDWGRLEKLVTFHAIRPVVFKALQEVDCRNEFYEKLKLRTFHQSVFNLATSKELSRLLNLFQQNQLRVIPYKGVLFIKEIYRNQALRETHDLDLLVHPEDAKKALYLLLADGYVLDVNNFRKLDKDSIIQSLFETPGIIEVGLDKISAVGINIHIDFHWHIKEEIHDFKVNYEAFFNENGNINQSQNTLFTMLLIHHGGRECWTRLKHFCDLIAFIKTSGMNINDLEVIASELGMKKFLKIGLEILDQKFLDVEIGHSQKHKVISDIGNYWETGKVWQRLDHRLRFTKIYFSLLDEKISIYIFVSKVYRYLSTPNFIENPRLITFPKGFGLLNFISKVITFIWRKTILQKRTLT